MTPDELALHADLNSVRVERERLIRDLDVREADLRERLARAQDREDRGLRALVTSQDKVLVAAVIDALTHLGFKVEDRDSALPAGAPRAEDLRIRDVEAPDWHETPAIRIQRHAQFRPVELRLTIAIFNIK